MRECSRGGNLEVPGSILVLASSCTLALLVPAWVSSTFSPQSKDVHVRLTGDAWNPLQHLRDPERGARLCFAGICGQEPPLALSSDLLCSPLVQRVSAPAWVHVFPLMSPFDSSAFGAFTRSFSANDEWSRLSLNFSCSPD